MRNKRLIGLATVLDNTNGFVRVVLDEDIYSKEENHRRWINVECPNPTKHEIGNRVEVYYISGNGYGMFALKCC